MKTIFLSYSHSDTQNADEIESFIREFQIDLIRDIKRLKYKDSILEFMNSAKEKDFLIALISEKYLKSENCLYELISVLHKKNNILPIIVNSYKEIDSIKLAQYWDNEYNTKTKEVEVIQDTELKSLLIQSIDHISEIKKNIVDIVAFLKENYSGKVYSEMKKSGFKEMLEFIKVPKNAENYTIIIKSQVTEQEKEEDSKTISNIRDNITKLSNPDTIAWEFVKLGNIYKKYGLYFETKNVMKKYLNWRLQNQQFLA